MHHHYFLNYGVGMLWYILTGRYGTPTLSNYFYLPTIYFYYNIGTHAAKPQAASRKAARFRLILIITMTSTTAASTSPRFGYWVSFFIFSTITLGATIEAVSIVKKTVKPPTHLLCESLQIFLRAR